MRSLISLVTLVFLTPALAFAGVKKLELLAVPSPQATAAEIANVVKSKLVANSHKVFNDAEAVSLRKLGDASLGNTLRLHFRTQRDLEDFRVWSDSHLPHIKIEANPILTTTAANEDPLLPLQWGLKNTGGSYEVDIDDFTTKHFPAKAGEDVNGLNAPAATKPVIVAVLDSGVDITHPDLAAAIVQHPAECAALAQYNACLAKSNANKAQCDATYNIDHDGNGYPLDCHGWNLAEEDDGSQGNLMGAPTTGNIIGNTDVTDFIGHGTHVAGIIAAQLNGVGGQGVAPNAKILPVRVISGEPSEVIQAQEFSPSLPGPQESQLNAGMGLGDVVARGLLYAMRSGAQVINLSLGWPDPLDSTLLRRLIVMAHSQGVMLVAAAGNDSSDSVILPCRYDGVICVGAHGPDGALTFFSNFGYGVDVLAPGWNIVSTYPTALMPINLTDYTGYESKDGTSMSAPFVAGVLARMLGLGMSADEAYSRLILGARPTTPSQIENPEIFANSSLSGNADLGRAIALSPQPLVQPSRKDPILVEWDGKSSTATIQFALANHWIDAKNVTVTAVPQEQNNAAVLEQSSWTIASWKAQSEQTFSTTLKILNPRVSSLFNLEITVSGAGLTERRFIDRVEIEIPVGPSTKGNFKILPILDANGKALNRAYDSILTVKTDANAGREYLGIIASAQGRTIDLLTENQNTLKLTGTLSSPPNGNEVNSLEKLTDPKTGAVYYVLLEILPAAPGQGEVAQFTYLTPQLKPTARASEKVDPKIAYLGSTYEWLLYNGELVATWYGIGSLPPGDQPPFNPWTPAPAAGSASSLSFNLYMLTPNGLHTIALPDSYPLMVSLVAQTAAQKKAGTVAFLLASGQDYTHTYAKATLSGTTWSLSAPLTLSTYHNLVGLIPATVLSLDPTRPDAGEAFSGYVDTSSGPKGSWRATVVGASTVADETAYPLRNFDGITDVTGNYTSAKRVMQFTLTNYEIQLHDYTNNSVQMTNQNRFSFLPSIYSNKSIFPLVLEDHLLESETGESRVPGVFVPGDYLYSKNTQVVAPLFSSSGKLKSLERPALFNLDSQPGCVALPTARAANASGPAELVFFCGDHFATLPLVY